MVPNMMTTMSGWKSLADYTGGEIYSSFAVMPVVFDSLPESGEDQRFDKPVIAYPVPADSHLWIEFEDIPSIPVNAAMYNLQGQLVLEKNFKAFQRKILLTIDNLSGGIYILRLREGSQVRTLRVAIMK